MPHTHDVIIVGRGIAGVVLSEMLRAMGKRVVVFDVPKPNAASPVAAGVVNPVVLRRTTLSWRAVEMLELAEPFYRSLEQSYDRAFWHPLVLAKLFHNEREASEWAIRMRDTEVGPFLASGQVPGFDADKFNAPHGYGVVQRCAWLDVEVMRQAHRSTWTALNALIEREVLPADVRATGDGVEVFGFSAPWIVWCNGPFAALPGLVPTRGEIMTLHLPELDAEAMVHRSGFLLPIGDNNYKLGSTFAWDEVWSGPTESGREELMRKLKNLVAPAFPAGQGNMVAGVRPATSDRRPILGQVAPRQAIFNGLGSRGVLLAPWCAQHLTEHLFNAAPLDPEVDQARFATG